MIYTIEQMVPVRLLAHVSVLQGIYLGDRVKPLDFQSWPTEAQAVTSIWNSGLCLPMRL